MAKYTFEIQTKESSLNKDNEGVGELFQLELNCEHSDDNYQIDNDFDITIDSDTERFECAVNYADNQEGASEVTAENYYKVRKKIVVFPRVNFYGNTFKTTIQKLVPVDGNFKYFGLAMNVIPISVEPEFFSGMNATINPWEQG